MPSTRKKPRTELRAFGSSKRESHDSSQFYDRFEDIEIITSDEVNRPEELVEQLGLGKNYVGDSRNLAFIPENSIALVVTSPPYFVGKEYEEGGSKSYSEHLQLLADVFRECYRVLEPGGRICVNVANLGRKPYRSQSADVIQILQDQIGFLLRGEIVWEKSKTSSGSCAWGSFAKASNPVLRDMTERVIVASKGQFDRAISVSARENEGLPHRSTLTNDEFMDATTDVWTIAAESARRVGHPAPFPEALPAKLINLYTYEDDLVLDPFAGVGTTVIAAASLGRVGIGIDNELSYVEAANQRLEEFAQSDRLFRVDQNQTYTEALQAGMKLGDLAERYLTDEGFTLDTSAKSCSHAGIRFDYLATQDDRAQLVEVVGQYLLNGQGVTATDEALAIVGRAALVLGVTSSPVLVLTAALPPAGSKARKVLTSAEQQGLIELRKIQICSGED